jgi:hypothetical protein
VKAAVVEFKAEAEAMSGQVVKFVVSTALDQESLEEIKLMREMKLKYYKNIVNSPDSLLEELKQRQGLSGLTRRDLMEYAQCQVEDLSAKLADTTTIHDEEFVQYVGTLQ